MAVWIGRIFGASFVLSCIAYVAGCGGSRVSTGASRSNLGQEKTHEPEPDRQPVAQEGCPTRIAQQLHFQYESSYVASTSFFVIDDITDAMAKYPDMKVTVVGHASSQEQHAVSLSHARANAVLKLLVSRNVAPGRLSAAGRGTLAPIVPNDTDEFRALNRRVEFVVTECRNGQGAIAKEPMDTTSVYLREHGTCRRSDAATPARDVTSTRYEARGAGSPDGGHVGGRLPPEVIQTIVRQHYGAFRACYEDGLRRATQLQGRVTVHFVINRDGVVSNVQNESSEMPDAKVVKCVMESYYALCFPPPEDDGRNPRSARLARPPAPVALEFTAMPGDHGGRFHDQQRGCEIRATPWTTRPRRPGRPAGARDASRHARSWRAAVSGPGSREPDRGGTWTWRAGTRQANRREGAWPGGL